MIQPDIESFLRPPAHLIIESSSRCNLLCPLCLWTQNPRHGTLAIETFARFLEPAHPHLDWLCFSGRGEPTLGPDLYDCIRLCADYNVRTNLGTNGSHLERDIERIFESKVDSVTVSLESDNAEEYIRYRVRGDFDRLTRGMGLLAEEKRRRGADRPLLKTCTVLFNYNAASIDRLKDSFASLGFEEFVFKSAHLGHGKLSEPREVLADQWLPADPAFRRAEPASGGLCGFLQQGHLLWNGDISRCAIDQEEMVVGNVHTATLAEIWAGPRSREVVERILSGAFSKCRECEFSRRSVRQTGSDVYVL